MLNCDLEEALLVGMVDLFNMDFVMFSIFIVSMKSSNSTDDSSWSDTSLKD